MIKSVTPAAEGEYECVGTNKYGEARGRTRLSVRSEFWRAFTSREHWVFILMESFTRERETLVLLLTSGFFTSSPVHETREIPFERANPLPVAATKLSSSIIFDAGSNGSTLVS